MTTSIGMRPTQVGPPDVGGVAGSVPMPSRCPTTWCLQRWQREGDSTAVRPRPHRTRGRPVARHPLEHLQSTRHCPSRVGGHATCLTAMRCLKRSAPGSGHSTPPWCRPSEDHGCAGQGGTGRFPCLAPSCADLVEQPKKPSAAATCLALPPSQTERLQPQSPPSLRGGGVAPWGRDVSCAGPWGGWACRR